jgi:hypothetical protein
LQAHQSFSKEEQEVSSTSFVGKIEFPEFSGVRCLMMPYIQGDPDSLPDEYATYRDIVSNLAIKPGGVGFLTIDESVVEAGKPHRGARAKAARALHTEAGRLPGEIYAWGGQGGGWGKHHRVTLDYDVQILLANSLSGTCAVWDAVHENTSIDGDIGDFAEDYPYSSATLLQAGDVHRIGILTPHESIPVLSTTKRQFLRIVSSGVHGREPYFTENPLLTI